MWLAGELLRVGLRMRLSFRMDAALVDVRAVIRSLLREKGFTAAAVFTLVLGIGVNLAVFTALLHGAGLHYRLAAVGSFAVAVTNNYTWNRLWTFRGQRGHVAYQGMRFFVVSFVALCANLVVLSVLVSLGFDEVLAQAIAIILVTPLNFVGNKLWSFRRH